MKFWIIKWPAHHESPSGVKVTFKTKHPTQDMSTMTINRLKMFQFFYKLGGNVSAYVYYKVLMYQVLLWLKYTYPEGNNLWNQEWYTQPQSQEGAEVLQNLNLLISVQLASDQLPAWIQTFWTTLCSVLEQSISKISHSTSRRSGLDAQRLVQLRVAQLLKL